MRASNLPSSPSWETGDTSVSAQEHEICLTLCFQGRQVEIPPQGKVSLPYEFASNLVLSDLASDTHGLDLLASLSPGLNYTCLFWWPVPISTLPTKPFLLTLVRHVKSLKSKGWTFQVRRCWAARWISSCLMILKNRTNIHGVHAQELCCRHGGENRCTAGLKRSGAQHLRP